MTGAELVNAAMEGALGDKLYVGLFHPAESQVNLYETCFASNKLRTTWVPSLRSSAAPALPCWMRSMLDRKSTRLNSSHVSISYAVFCLKKKIDIWPRLSC